MGEGEGRSAIRQVRRVLVKVSGEGLAAPDGYWLNPDALRDLARDLANAASGGRQLAVMVGGGNIIRGARVAAAGWIDRPTADSMGMLATVMNALALEAAINATGAKARTMSAIAMPSLCEAYSRQKALDHLSEGRIVILAGGTGNPFFTTDTGAVLRAAELGCGAVLKATQVDGVYSADPRKDPSATRYERLTHDDAIAGNLQVMDTAAFALARDGRLSIIVGSIHAPSSVSAIMTGEAPATIVTP
jgi:uridylate kinase